MEVFADFGMFELIAALGLSALARALYSRRWLGIGVLSLSVVVPAVLVFLVPEASVRWLALANLGLALVNGAVVLGAMRAGSVSELLSFPWPRRFARRLRGEGAREADERQ